LRVGGKPKRPVLPLARRFYGEGSISSRTLQRVAGRNRFFPEQAACKGKKRIVPVVRISCHVTLRGRKTPPGSPENPRTWGEHLKRRRLTLGLRQREVAERLGVTTKTYTNWERGVSQRATVRSLPEVIRFLGYDPRPAPETFPERLRFAREGRGLSVQGLAALLGIVPSTILAWEKGWRRPGRVGKTARAVAAFLAEEGDPGTSLIPQTAGRPDAVHGGESSRSGREARR
jgi:transcriptional regulator with XRE-family HTH domain